MPDPDPTPKGGRRGARPGASSSRPPEADRFEQEFPGASWLAVRSFRELVVDGTSAEGYVAAIARRYGLSHIAMNVLAVIEGNGGPLPAGAVGERVHITSGSTTSVLDTLERNGLIERLADPDDRRRVLVEVTPEAQELLDRLLADVSQAVSVALDRFSEQELETFRSMLIRVREAIAEAPTDLGPPPARRTPPELRRAPRKG
jgi:DNA-binding MarR family transcriptional regulator